MAGDVNLDASAEHFTGFESAKELGQSFRLTRDHGGARPIADRNGKTPLELDEGGFRFVHRKLDQGHLTLTADPSQQLTAAADYGRTCFERECPSDTRRRYLPHAMSHHRVGLDAPGAPDRCQRYLHREQ